MGNDKNKVEQKRTPLLSAKIWSKDTDKNGVKAMGARLLFTQSRWEWHSMEHTDKGNTLPVGTQYVSFENGPFSPTAHGTKMTPPSQPP